MPAAPDEDRERRRPSRLDRRLGRRCPEPLDPDVALFRSIDRTLDPERHGRRLDGAPEKGARVALAERSRERVAQPGRRRLHGRVLEQARVASLWRPGRRGLRSDLPEHRVRERRDARSPGVAHRLDGLVDGRERGDAGEEHLVRRERHARPHVRVELAGPARGVLRDLRLEPGRDAERAVDELRRQRSIARVEIGGASELGLEGGRREGVLLLHPHEHARRDIAGAVHRALMT